MGIKPSVWKKAYRPMEYSGWCGQAVTCMTLAAVGIRKSQRAITQQVYMPGFGTTQHSLFAYLSKFFGKIGFREGARFRHVRYHVSRGHIVIVNWWDDFDRSGHDGHYTLVQSIRSDGSSIRLIDPEEDRGIWNMKTRAFLARWYDYLDVHQSKRLDRWFMWIDPESKVPHRKPSRRVS